MATLPQPALREGPGWEALRDGRWDDARRQFELELESGETPELLEGLGRATRWLNEIAACFEAQERAFLLYKERGDLDAAAYVAVNLARDTATTRADDAVAQGWFSRAESLLEGLPECAAHAWLDFRRGELAYFLFNEIERGRALLVSAAEIGRRHGDFDVEMAARSQLGVIQVTTGEIEAGMKALDEAATAAVAGEVQALDIAGGICCDVIFACERVRDVDRAKQWCTELTKIAEGGQLSPLLGACRAHYATILIWQGEWEQAESELDRARELIETHAPGISRERRERLAGLRVMQGRLDEAWELCEAVEWSPGAKYWLARIAFLRGDLDLARELLDRHLRSLGPEERLARMPALDLGVELAIAQGDAASADSDAAELEEMAAKLDIAPLTAAAKLSRARVFVFSGDDESAVPPLEQAIDVWSRNGAQYEAAIARAELSEALSRLGRESAARVEAERSAAALGALGAVVPEAPAGPGAGSGRNGVLTKRETEVLKLVAEGLNDDQVAERLVVSPHTVHRHMANIRTKLDQPSRAAAVAHAAREGLI